MMADKCVVCGESDEGKPLYKKLGSGEYNVEVIAALRILELTSLPDSAKNDHYICWDCDETIVAEYGRFVESEDKRQIKVEEVKAKRKRKRAEQRDKKKQEEKQLEEKLRTDKVEKRKSGKVEKAKDNILRISTDTTNGTHAVSKTKKLEIERAKNAYNMNHCLLCDSTFDSSLRGYQRFSLKKIVTDEMDIASVIEQLGLARHIAPEMKSKRFACANCFYTIRRNYKDKIEKGSSLGETPVELKNIAQRGSFHRATPDEHAAEIAKLLPPALAECYKIMTSESFDSKEADDKNTNKAPKENAVDQKAEGDMEEEEEGLCVSQDELGNYVVNMNLRTPPKTSPNQTEAGSNGKENAGQPAESPCTPRKKKNILLPKRHHHHLVASSSSQTGGTTSFHNSGDGTGNRSEVAAGELDDSRTCNICGHTVVGKPADWWHTLSSPLSAFETITVSMALQLLETSLASTSEKARQASQVCLPCYGMVSTGFRLQIVQRIARQKNIDPSKVNLSKVKFHMMKMDDKLLTNRKEERVLGEKHASNKENKVAENAAIENKDMNGPNCEIKNSRFDEMGTKSGVKRLKRNSDANEEKKVKKLKVSDIIKTSSVERNKGEKTVGDCTSKSFSSESDSDVAFNDSHDVSHEGDHSPVNDASYLMSSDSDFEIRQRKHKANKKTKRRKLSRQTPVKTSKNNLGIKAVPANKTDKNLSVGKSITDINKVSQKDGSEIKGILDVTGNSCSDEVNDKKQPALYEVLPSCTLYFSISKMKRASVVLRDIGEVLPKEAFDGRTLNVRLNANSSYQICVCEDTTSPLQYILNSLATPSHLVNPSIWVKENDLEADSLTSGRCVVCASQCNERKFFWHKLEENINPPSIQVPVRWVCASLSIAPVAVSESDRAKGLVCRNCFVNLSSEFDVFVRTKIGESCDIPPSEVEISDYIVTFNQDTMNIEADPVDVTPEEEIEESEKILSKIMPVIQSIGLDALVGECNRVPLAMHEYSIWLLLVLNEFRVQLERDLHYLVDWLTRLMPLELYSEGLCPSEDRLLPFIRSLADEWSLSSKDSFDKLNTKIPLDLFDSREASVFSNPSHLAKEIKEEIPPPGIHQKIALARKQKSETQWEDFLLPVDLDRLLQGTAKPLPREDFNNGLLYAFWRLQQTIGGDENQLADWIKQVSPITLEKKHLQLLLNAPEPVHEHLKNHPEDIDKLRCLIIPESVQIKPKNLQNKAKPLESNKKHEKVNASIIIDSEQSTNKLANQTTRVRKKRGRPRKTRPVKSTVRKVHGSQRGNTSGINKKTHSKSQVLENHIADSKENETSIAMKLGHCKTAPKTNSLDSIYSGKNIKKVIQKSSDTDTCCLEQVSLQVQESKASQVDRSSKETNATSRLKNNVKNGDAAQSSKGLATGSKTKVSSVLGKQDNSFRNKNVSADEGECSDDAALLANKVKELERQLLAMKKENEALLQINQKLSETVSSDELEDATKNLEDEKTVKTNEIKLVKAITVNQSSPHNVPCIPKYSMDEIKEVLLEPVDERAENSKSLCQTKKKSNSKGYLHSNSKELGNSQGKQSVLMPGRQVEQVELSVAESTNNVLVSLKNEQLSKTHSSLVDGSLDSTTTSDSQKESRIGAQGPCSKTTPHVLDKKHTKATKSPETSSANDLSKTKQKQVKPKPRFEDLLNYDT